jgi:hypothetical protein
VILFGLLARVLLVAAALVAERLGELLRAEPLRRWLRASALGRLASPSPRGPGG